MQKSRLARMAGRLSSNRELSLVIPRTGQEWKSRRAAKWFRQQHITQVVLKAGFIILCRYKHPCCDAVNRIVHAYSARSYRETAFVFFPGTVGRYC
jgi:hypothetical protein